LNEKGYRTLRFGKSHPIFKYKDMYGRGHSDAPITAYSEYLFVNQTEELIRALEKKGILSPNQKFDFFGYSLGYNIFPFIIYKRSSGGSIFCKLSRTNQEFNADGTCWITS
jgi:hypothetical protein